MGAFHAMSTQHVPGGAPPPPPLCMTYGLVEATAGGKDRINLALDSNLIRHQM